LVDLKALCESTLEEYLDAAANKGIDLGLDAHLAHVQGHEWLLRELLGNLVDNAIRYTPRGGHVTLRCGIAGEAYLEVEDDGPGVPAAERKRMPERFYRVPGTPGEGNGLGLAIADEIARVHGSRLHIEAGAAGKGLRVSLRVPVRE
jgi:two-component system sensor histidine kinase TctE